MTPARPRKTCRTALALQVVGFSVFSGALPLYALEFDLPGDATLAASTPASEGLHPIATGPWDGTQVPSIAAEGIVQEFTWQITGENVTAASLFSNLRGQFEAQGYVIGFTCAAEACGGFDFRHALPVGQAPEMHIDLGNYHYLTATLTEEGSGGESHAAVMISQGGLTGFVHLALVQPADVAAVAEPVTHSSRAPDTDGLPTTIQPLDASALAQTLLATGSAPLDDLRFETGASELSNDTYPSLIALAEFLNADTSRMVALVGHTDATGSLDANIALSRARAEAVRQYLTSQLGVSATQISAEGIGYLSPRANNTSAEGRDANRRVEVVLTSLN